MRYIDLIVVHCSATRPTLDIGAAEIRAMHLELGWPDIGYHTVIRRDGTLDAGRPMFKVGSHAKGYNRHSIGICLIGGVDQRGRPEANYTQDQYESLDGELVRAFTLYPHAQLAGHRDLSPDLNGDGVISPNEWVKQCPCFDVRAWWGKRIARTLAPLDLG